MKRERSIGKKDGALDMFNFAKAKRLNKKFQVSSPPPQAVLSVKWHYLE